MSQLNMIFSIIAKIFLNPMILILYIIFLPTNGLIQANVNDSFINYKKFIPFVVIAFLVWSLLIYGLNSSIKVDSLSLRDHYRYIGDWRWPNLIAWALTLFILNIFRTGMEGNIFGFFGMPILILASIFQIFAMWPFLTNDFSPTLQKLLEPFSLYYAQLSMTKMILTFMVLNPVFLYCFREFTTEKEGLILNLVAGLIANLITIGLLLMIWVGLIWIFKNFFMEKMAFFDFFKAYFHTISFYRLVLMTLTFLTYVIFLVGLIIYKEETMLFKFMLMTNLLWLLMSESHFLYNLMKKVN